MITAQDRRKEVVLMLLLLTGSWIFFISAPARANSSDPYLNTGGNIHPSSGGYYRRTGFPPLLAAQIDLDYVYDPDAEQQEKNLRNLVNRACSLGITTVLLQAFADPDGNGVADALYFPNRFLALKRDLFTTVAGELKQCGLSVFAWMPMLAFIPTERKDELAVLDRRTSATHHGRPAYYRLSPFNPEARDIILGIYEDLALSGPFDGILFHDDAVLSDYEDASPAALATYRQAGFPASIENIRKNDSLMSRWSRFKTNYLISFSHALLDIVRRKQPDIRSGRNLYTLTILEPESEQWLAQALPPFLQAYDYTFIMAMPYMEKAKDADQWLSRLANISLALSTDSPSVVFELQTFDWWRKEKIPMTEFTAQLSLLQRKGAVSFAYYPDDFLENHPDAEVTRQWFSQMKNAWAINSHDCRCNKKPRHQRWKGYNSLYFREVQAAF